MMELADSSDEHPQLNDLPNPTDSTTRSASGTGIGIDLNEIPSPSSFSETLSDTFEVVRTFHDNPPPSDAEPAHVPRGVRGSVCGLCGQPEVRGHVVVCDGCERGFHLACTGMRGAHALNFEDWVCGDCFTSGVKSKRWPLGVKSKQLLDINASPPSDGDACGEDGEELPGFRYGVLWVKWGIVCVVTFGYLLVLATAVIVWTTSFEFSLLHDTSFELGSLHIMAI